MPANIQRETMPSGKMRDHLIPAARMESSGMAKENRRILAAPFPNGNFNSIDGDSTVDRHS